MRSVCVLTREELKNLEQGIQPNHAHHRHVSRREAVELVRPDLGDPKQQASRPEPMARWVGPRQIAFIQEKEWRSMWIEGGYRQRQLVDRGAPSPPSPFVKFITERPQ